MWRQNEPSDELGRVEDAFNRYKVDYTLCFIDIDNFKVVNDTYGHEAGDVILSTVGKILRKYVRQVDFVGRYGGEEFLVILPSVELLQGVTFANKIRSIVEQFKFLYKNERINITSSVVESHNVQCMFLRKKRLMLDGLLYKAKEEKTRFSPNSPAKARFSGGSCLDVAPIKIEKLPAPAPAA